MKISNITIIGAGNIGTYFACVAAAKGFRVSLHSSKPEQFDRQLSVVDSTGTETCRGELYQVTADLGKAMCDADLIFVTHPASLFHSLAAAMEPHIRPGVILLFVPGTGGAEFAFRHCAEKGAVLAGLQRVPCVCRLVEYGKTVRADGKREKLFLASIPTHAADELSCFMANLFDMLCDPLPNYLCVTMTPSNPILHTTRLYTMLSDWAPGTTYDRNPLFYGEWSDRSSEMLLACDAEHQAILRVIDGLDLTSVRSLREHYESDTVQALTAKMRSIKSLHNITSPMKPVGERWEPDFSSRYFTADFPFGLSIIDQFAQITGVPAPHIHETLDWYRRTTGDQSALSLGGYGIRSVADIVNLYR